jgi:hypothetical protein
MFDANKNPEVFGYLIFIWSLVGLIGSIPCFWYGGKYHCEN